MDMLLFQLVVFIVLMVIWYFIFGSNRSKKEFVEMVPEKAEKTSTVMKNVTNVVADKKINYTDVIKLMNQIVEMDKVFLTKIKSDSSLNESKKDLQNMLQIRMKTIEYLTTKYSSIFSYAQDESRHYANLILLNHPDLSEKEVRLCYYFKMNLSAKDIANLEGLTHGSVRVYKTKIKAKMRVHPSGSLTAYLKSFDAVV
jgi:DNA-binding CsgD family transcriptional regulator